MKRVDVDRYRELAAQGYSQSTAATIMGVSRERVRQIANKHAIEFMSGRRGLDARDAVAELVEQGLTDQEIAARLGRSISVVGAFRRDMGMRSVRRYRHVETLRALAAQGLSQSEAVRRSGVAQSHVSRMARQHGITFVDGRAKRFWKQAAE